MAWRTFKILLPAWQSDSKLNLICGFQKGLFVCLFDWAPEVPVMSVPVVGFSFKPKGLAFVTPLFHLSGYGEGDL